MSPPVPTPRDSPALVWARKEALTWVLVVGLLWLLYQVVQPFISPLIWAVVMAVFFYPAHAKLQSRLGRRNLSALLSLFIVALLLVLPVALLTPAFVGQTAQMLAKVPAKDVIARINQGMDFLSARLPPTFGDLDANINEGIAALRGKVGGWSAKLVGNLVGFILDFIVLLLALFYLFRDGEELVLLLREVSPFGGERHDLIMKQTTDMISVTISSSFVVAAAQGSLGGLSFAILGMPSPIFWGVMTALMALLPFVGAWMIWLPAGISLLLEGEIGRGVAMLILGAALVSTVDNVLRPILIAGRSQLNGLLVFISVLGGIQAFGLMGIVLGPLIAATAVGLITGYRDSLHDGRHGHESDASAV